MSVFLPDISDTLLIAGMITNIESAYPKLPRGWGQKYHAEGNIESVDYLVNLFLNGMLDWYLNKILSDTKEKNIIAQNYKKGEKRIRFWDLNRMIDALLTDKVILDDGLKKFIDDFLGYNGGAHTVITRRGSTYNSFTEYYQNHKDQIQKILKLFLESYPPYEESFELVKDLALMDINKCQDSIIMKAGVVYQRWKVVLEKIIDKNSDQPVGEYIYKVDSFLTKLQTLIYRYSEHLIKNPGEEFTAIKSEPYDILIQTILKLENIPITNELIATLDVPNLLGNELFDIL